MGKIEAMKKGRRIAYLKRCLIAQDLLQKHETTTSKHMLSLKAQTQVLSAK